MKKHLLFKFLLTFSLALFTVGWVNGQEIIDNWTTDGGSISYAKETSEVHGGSASIEITWTSTSNQYLNSEEFAVTAGQTLEISTWVYDNDAAGRARLCVMYTGASSYYGGYSNDGTSWEELTYSGTVPTGATAAYIQIRFYDVSPFDGDATVLVDDVSYIMNSGSNVVTNPGFENWSVQPIISNIVTDPGVVQATETVSVSADVDPNTTTVNSVTLNWGTVSGTLGTPITMTKGSGNTWTTDTDIPGQVLGTDIYYDIEVSYDTETLNSDEQSYTVVAVTEVADIATLRAGAQDGTIYKLTGEVVLTFNAGGSRNQKFIQDATAAILIDDDAGKITTSYNVGDGITGIFGTLGEYNGITQFVPEADPGDATAGYAITPQEITISEFNTNYTDYESELIKFVDVNFNGADGTGTFNDDTDYDLGDGTNTTTFRYGYAYSLDYQGNTMPHESIDVTLVGIGARYNTTPQFYCRNAADMTIPDYIVITSPADNTIFDTETDITVDFVTYNQTDLLKLQAWVPDQSAWVDMETDIDPATGTVTSTVPADAAESSSYKVRLLDQTDSDPTSNEVPIGVNDVTGPVFNYFDPADGATDVARNQNLIIDFNEDIQAGTGNIIIKKYADDEVVATYGIGDAEIDITGTTLTITPATDWPNYTKLYAEVAASVIEDLQGNTDFSVVKDDWDFTTLDNVAPQPTFNPANTETDVARNGDLTITFDEPIYAIGGAAFDDNTIDALITLSEGTTSGGTPVTFDATINGTFDIITINPTANFSGLTDYYYAITNQFEDAAGNQGSAAEATFETIDDSAPIVTIVPANGSNDIDRDTTIAITFDKAVRNLDDSAVEDADLAAMITLKETNASGADVAFTATINVEKDSISVVPDATLKAGQIYYVAISADLESETGTAIAATNVSFTTIDDEAPVATFNPEDAEIDVAVGSNITITMNEAILNTDASVVDDANVDALITLKETNASGSNITFDATIDAGKQVITINPSSDFDYNQDVYVALAAVEDALGNESSLQTATFTTVPNDDATLSNLTVNGATVSGFNPATYTYTHTVPYGTTVVPTVAGIANDPDANAVATQATNLDGTEAERTAKVVVTAEDGTTELTYNVIFEIGPEGDLFFSEYIESGNDKAFEIYNPTGASIDLSDYTVKQSHNGTGWGVDGIAYVLPLNGTIDAGEVYVVAGSDAASAILDEADLTLAYSDEQGHKVPFYNGDDAMGLFKNDVLIDVIGIELTADGAGPWNVGDTLEATEDYTLIRKYDTYIGTNDWAASAGTDNDDSQWMIYPKGYSDNIGYPTYNPSEANIVDFSFEENNLAEAPVIDNNAATVSVKTVFGTDLSDQTAVLELSTGASTTDTHTDFTSAVTYNVKAEDGTTKLWTVTCTVSTTQSSDAEITDVEVEGSDSIKINSSTPSATIYVPYEFDVTAVKPTFKISAGATISPDTSVARDFTSSVDFTVTAQDASTKVWTVSFEKPTPTELSIYDIQYTTGTGASEHVSEFVKTSGIVTAAYANGYFIQDKKAAWHGLFILDYDNEPSVGDSVEVVGEVAEYQDHTEIGDIVGYEVLNTGLTIFDPLAISTDDAALEKYEGVLVSISEAECTVAPDDHNVWTVNDGSGALNVDDVIYEYTPTVGSTYDITGIMHGWYGTVLLPRSANDVNTYPVIDEVTIDPTTPTSADDVTVSATITDVETSSLTVKLFYGSAAGSESTEVTFTETSTADVFEGTIPASTSDVYYKITASDGSAETSATGNYSVTATGITNPDGIVSMNIFPNPSNGLFTIEMNASKAGTFNVQIINIQGQVVYNKEINQDGFYKNQIDISNEASGIYYIRINDGKNMNVSKIMIQ